MKCDSSDAGAAGGRDSCSALPQREPEGPWVTSSPSQHCKHLLGTARTPQNLLCSHLPMERQAHVHLGCPEMKFAGNRLGSPWGRGWRRLQPTRASTSRPHGARREPAPQLPPPQLWVTSSCSKNRPQTKQKQAPNQNQTPGIPPAHPAHRPSPGHPAWHGTAELLCAPSPAHLQGAWTRALLLPQNFPFELLQIPLQAGSTRSRRERSPGQPASSSPAPNLQTEHSISAPHDTHPSPRRGPAIPLHGQPQSGCL